MSSAPKATTAPRRPDTRIIRSSPRKIFLRELKAWHSRLCLASCDAFENIQSRPVTKTGQNKLTKFGSPLVLVRNRNETNRQYYIYHGRWFWNWSRPGRSIAQARQSDHHLRAAQEPS